MENIRISGKGTIAGGDYGTIYIDGIATCSGEIHTEKIRADGKLKCTDNVHAKEFFVDGWATCEKDIQTEKIKIDGRLQCSGTVTAKELLCDGLTSCEKDVKADRIQIDGKWKCQGSAEIGQLSCDGMAEVKGSIQAEKVDNDGILKAKSVEASEVQCDGAIIVEEQVSADVVNADGFVSAKEVVGDSITIKSKKSRIVWFFMKADSKIGLIEATTIHLRGVHAGTVNGRDIVIEAGCEIEELDCSGTLRIAPGAKVKHITGEYQMI